MPKIISYTCDKCNKPTEYDELNSITVYCFSESSLDEPKILELDLVCPDCREQFSQIIRGWTV